MNWITTTLNWYFYLFLIGLIFVPLSRKLFNSFFDRGYPFAKVIGIIILTYLTFILGITKILPFTQTTLFLILAVFFLGYVYIRKKNRKPVFDPFTFNKHMLIYVLEEAAFLAALFFLAFIRSQEPSIHGLEKFMDFGFINSILKSKYFPPVDMWYAGDLTHPNGFPINYYYFGHLSGALLIKLSETLPSYGYNLILATIFAQAITATFSLVGNIVYAFRASLKQSVIVGILGSFLVNFAGNLHTIYLFTDGYPVDNPVPFWNILSGYNPSKYWYPNATRFIPFTIHEFPVYSYVVADLHGHVFDIPFVILTLTLLFLLFTRYAVHKSTQRTLFIYAAMLGFMTALHYMTNAFDGPIYLLFIAFILFVAYGFKPRLFQVMGVVLAGFVLFSNPFSSHFQPFVSGIGVNCSPDFLVNIKKFGPFLFEKGNCQPDPFWMLFVLWGFFWINLVLFFINKFIEGKQKIQLHQNQLLIDDFIFMLFTFGTVLIIIPEFFYIKDIYPAHFRANTMFKMGYQAFIMMGIASAFTFYRITRLKNILYKSILLIVFAAGFFFVSIYPFYAFPSYYGAMNKTPDLDGLTWLSVQYPEDKEIVDYLNNAVQGQPVVLEAQGDSYTDFERISANTGMPTVAGWWVHEWLWRGTSDVVGNRIPDIVALYESKDLALTRQLITKYHIQYVVVSKMEKDRYKNLYEDKFNELGDKVFTSSNGFGALYQIKNK